MTNLTKLVFCLLSSFCLYGDLKENFHNPSFFESSSSVFLVHIPKAAGTSCRGFLINNFRNEQVISKKPSSRLEFYPTAYLDEIFKKRLPFMIENTDVFYFSHTPLYYLENCIDKVSVLTLIRDPVKRQKSHINYFALLSLGSENKLFVLDQNKHKMTSATTPNLQTLYLSLLNPFDSSISMEKHLESAKFNLRYKIAFFGITEWLQESLEEFLKKFGINQTSKVTWENTSFDKKIPKIDMDLEKIKEANWADIELYEFAKDLFLTRYPHYRAKFNR
jgi:hypothetical protein